MLTNASLVAEIQGLDKSFKYSKKKHTRAVLEKILKTARADAGEYKHPAKLPDEPPKFPRKGSIRHTVMLAMAKDGVTIDDLKIITKGWAENACRSFFGEDVANQCNTPYVRRGKRYFLDLPKGVQFPVE